MTISPDDPALWGATGVTYDWVQVRADPMLTLCRPYAVIVLATC